MGHVAGVAQPPPLDRARADLVVDAVRVEHLAVDRPERAVVAWPRSGRTSRSWRPSSGTSAPAPAAGDGQLARVWCAVPRTRNCMIAADRRAGARAASSLRGTSRARRSRRLAAEVDDDVGALGRPEQDVLPHDRLGQQPVAGADLDERPAVGEREVVGGEQRGVEQPEPVAARAATFRYGAKRPLTRIWSPTVASFGGRHRAGHPVAHVRPGNGSVSWLSVVEAAVGDQSSGTSYRPCGSPSCALARVGDEEHALQAEPVVAGGPVHPVVVVEAEAGRLGFPPSVSG